MKIGNFVKIKCGCSKWLKDHHFWSDSFGSSIDGLVGKIENDYTDSPIISHFGIKILNHFYKDEIGIPSEFLEIC